MPTTYNKIEEDVNAQLRAVLRTHRGMSPVRRIKTVYRWRYMHTEHHKGPVKLHHAVPCPHAID